MTPVETLVNVVDRIYPGPENFWLKDAKPGETFARLPEEEKEILRDLRSGDLARVRPDVVRDIAGYCEYRCRWARDYRRRNAPVR
jgi:hypothetical protein